MLCTDGQREPFSRFKFAAIEDDELPWNADKR
jgi:hypothetical protein